MSPVRDVGEPPRPRSLGRGSTVQVIERLAHILELFAATRQEMRANEVASALQLQRSTAHRYLGSLSAAGFLRQDAGTGTFSLGPLLIQLGAAALGDVHAVNLAQRHLHQLAEEVGETVCMSLWTGQFPVVVRVHEPTNRLVWIHIPHGALVPLESAQGHVFLAYHPDRSLVQRLLAQFPDSRRRELEQELEEVRDRGVWISSRVARGIRAVAAPVFDHERIVSALAIVGTMAAIPGEFDSGLVHALKATAQRLSRELGQGQRFLDRGISKTPTAAEPAKAGV